MTETISLFESQPAEPPHLPRPETDGAALRAIDEATAHVRQRALKIGQAPELHKPKLVLSKHVRGTSTLDRIAAGVNFASRDMPGRQREIQDCVNKILAMADSRPAAT